MKVINTILFCLACMALNAQILIDNAKKEPDLIVRSHLDTLEGDYLTEAGVFRGFIVRKTYRVTYAAIYGHNGLEFEQVVEILNSDKKRVKDVLGWRELVYFRKHVGTPWVQYQITPAKK